jgi:hypothetical protein
MNHEDHEEHEEHCYRLRHRRPSCTKGSSESFCERGIAGVQSLRVNDVFFVPFVIFVPFVPSWLKAITGAA